jgi:hypothetical protein
MAIEANDDIVNILATEDSGSKGFSARELLTIVVQETTNADAKINSIKNTGSAISIADMFEMQMRMNRLSQFSEMSTAVVSAANGALSSIARNVK